MMECPRLNMTVSDVAIHWMPLIESMEQSVGDIGKVLLVAGQSECFQKVGLQLKRGRGTLLRHKDDGDMSFMSAEENELFDPVRVTHCPEMPLHHRTANGGPDVRDHRTAYPSILFARAHRSRPPLPAIDRAIRTAIHDGRTAPMTCPRLASSFQAQTYRAGVKITCTTSTLTTLSRFIPLAYWNEGRNHILFEYSDAPCLPWDAEHGILAKVGLSAFHHRDGLDVSMSLFSMVTFIHSHRSSDAFRPRKQDIPRHLQVCALPSLLALMPCATTSPSCTMAGVVCCACDVFFVIVFRVCVVRGRLDMTPQRKSSTSSSTSTRTRRPSLGSSSWLRVPSPSLSSMRRGGVLCMYVFVCVRMCVSAYAFAEHMVLNCGLPRILRSISDEVVEMMRRRVVFVFEEFFKSLSTQVHTALLESARINLFSGDNAWQRALEPAAVTPPSTTTALAG
ncbi:hypothetical protein PTSG_08727 [Salpingoeca rosetta]|uniref:Uncharacterized protein n=1 Tax=Salpingoeca rosetta (strain ATCC 50818 / BSB-021) TaxID=946362 RepID=F2UKI6_SALR5|nr:uncharacterized protein PTSG_08727 [Salpingoeca rosetta]EGD77635.1 hypothetical protein PTSG_08727 [Salpingoeca rosetta]|eukprot:XP_004990111.1 hypothetical protein PTSG_08727 [Salpingoeca rosetta]